MTAARTTTQEVAKIELKNISKAFGHKQVLRGVNLVVTPGESLVIIGGSGTGKSVLLKCILGLIEVDSGKILLDGDNVTAMSHRNRLRHNRRIGMLFQGAALFDSLTVWQNISFGAMQDDELTRKQALDLAVDKLSQVGLPADVAYLHPAELSGGMQKRVALARAIANDPEIIFFDEPTTGLDPIMADVINNLIISCVKKLGATAISITHDMVSARKIADRIAMLYDGQVIWEGPVGGPHGVDHSGNGFVDQFIHGRADGPIKMAVRV